jgi:hypothetical protein
MVTPERHSGGEAGMNFFANIGVRHKITAFDAALDTYHAAGPAGVPAWWPTWRTTGSATPTW